MNALADALEAQLSVSDWFKRVEPLAGRGASRALAMLGTSKIPAKAYYSMTSPYNKTDRIGTLVDRSA